jgi:sulfite reductase (NADPH) hemoprotein beta-component
MYQYNELDQTLVNDRVEQFRHQTQRYLNGELSDEQFLPLRLQNGLYIQRHAPMLRIAIPYGMVSSQQLRTLADISERYDRGYGHISTRQNIQLNWPELEQVPDILAELAQVQMHAIQTSGNCIRNVTTDQFAGVADDEVEDPRPWCELLRQWSTLHPEFAFLPRKFKIAVNANTSADRAAIRFHDIGLQIKQNDLGETVFDVWVGGGLGRTPIIGSLLQEDLPPEHLLSYLEAILRVYNLFGRRDNKYKARIKILVRAMGIEAFRERVEHFWQPIKNGPLTVSKDRVAHLQKHFSAPDYSPVHDLNVLDQQRALNPAFQKWLEYNTHNHRVSGYRIVTLSLKAYDNPPGDITASQLRVVADLADRYSFGEARTTHEQNIVLSDVREDLLYELWLELSDHKLATANIGTLTDIICCPGGDFCALANAKSIPIASAIQQQFEDLDDLYDLGPIDLNISGCMNACGHHHIGHIGILGVDKKGNEYYQVSIGGNSGDDASLGGILGPSFDADDMPRVIQQIIDVFVSYREGDELFIDVVKRIGAKPFKEKLYGQKAA